MNIVMITTNDPAGTAIAFSKAINRYTEHRCRLITTEIRYNFYFEKDLHVPSLGREGFEEIDGLLKEADIIHFHMVTDESIQLGPINVSQYIGGKKLVHHHHGHPHFRAHPEIYREKYRRLKRKSLVSTPDLLRMLPGARWQPNLVPIYDTRYCPAGGPVNGVIRIGQSPTRKDLKNTEEFVHTVEKISQRCTSPRVELNIIDSYEHRECLKRKNRCHIMFDHMQGYYGVSSLESLSQGKPVITGLDEWNTRCIRELTGCDRLPWVIAHDQTELEKELTELIRNPEWRQTVGGRSRHFMENHWTECQIVGRLVDFYEGL